MEHLSPEERACLMYLEETIEALEVQEDSGLSNDEPEPAFQTGMGVNDVSSLKSDASGRDQTSEPGSRGFSFEDQAVHHALHQTSEPSVNLMTQPEPPVTESADDCKTHPSASELCVSKDADGHLQIVPIASLCPVQSNEASEIDMGVIPPPSDFMDEPALPPQIQNVKYPPPSAGISNDRPGATVDLEQLRQRASASRNPGSSSVTQNPPIKSPNLSLPALSSGPPMSLPPDAVEPRSPPVVAPKPKRLPANIILKSHKAAVSDNNLEHSMPTSSDRLLLDPQRIRIEALRKLGLLPAEADSGPALSPSLSPQSRSSWAAPLSPISPKPPHTPPFTSSYSHVNSSPPACIPFQYPAAVTPSATSTAPEIQPAEVLPAPAAFSDSVGPPLSDNKLSTIKDASVAAVNAQVSTLPQTPPSLVKHLTPPKVMGVKSATLERSGLGLSSYLASQESAKAGIAKQLHKNRPRQASLGNGKEFTSEAGREGFPAGRATSKEPELRRSLPTHKAFQHSGESKKLPRSQGISVLICPRSENGEDRRDALKKLGLLRD
ncbi:specifically androgen-regulated gene protein-like isoform X2 [Anoplopoma fimbria]|nr:specifically androgen-regulated gene protein-like isoform X2 [Anoplopoma fimbria]